MEIKNMNSLTLAYIGDAIYEIYIRKYLVMNCKLSKVKTLQKEAVKFVSARGQDDFLKKLIDENFLTPIETEVMLRARNHKTTSHPKNTDIIVYKYATGLEAIFGYLYLEDHYQRLEEWVERIVGEKVCLYTEKML